MSSTPASSSSAAARPLVGHVDTTRLHMTKAFNAAESVEQHYTSVAATYRNPHFQGIKKALFVFLNRWYETDGRARFEQGLDHDGEPLDDERQSHLAVIDLACGSGEVTECLEEWHRLGLGAAVASSSSSSAAPTTIGQASDTSVAPPAVEAQPLAQQLQQQRQQVATTIHPALLTNLRAPLASRPAFIPPNRRKPAGPPPAAASTASEAGKVPATAASPAAPVSNFSLTVPHAHTAAAKARDALNGGQYASLVPPIPLSSAFRSLSVLPTDPFTLPSFDARHPNHRPTPLALSFADVTAGGLPLPECYRPTKAVPVPKYDMVVCSFALNLAEAEDERAERWEGRSKSLAWKLIWELSTKAEWLVVLGANKRPEIGEGSGWARWDLANWRPAALSALQEAEAGQKPDDEQEREEGMIDSAVEVRRDRVRMRVYRSVLGTA